MTNNAFDELEISLNSVAFGNAAKYLIINFWKHYLDFVILKFQVSIPFFVTECLRIKILVRLLMFSVYTKGVYSEPI